MEFSELRKKCKKLNQICHDQYISDIENSFQINIKPFWNYVNSLKNTKNNVPNCMNYNNVTSTNISETVKLFVDYFSSVYVNSSLNSDEVETLPNLSSIDNHINLSSWSIDPNEMYEYLTSLDPHTGTGPDGIPSAFLKNCSSVLVKPLHFIFNKSLNLDNFPDSWKRSFVSPIHKAGNRHNIANYRPISKMSIIPKIFEAIITKKTFHNCLSSCL